MFEPTKPWSQRPARIPLAEQAGLSLMEVLFAAFLVATVAVFLAPLFMRAVASNIEGNEASTAINFDKGFLEQTQATPYNHNSLDLRQINPAAIDTTIRRILSLVFDAGPFDRGSLERELGDERWLVRTAALEGYGIGRRWDFDLDLREYSYADLIDALVSAVNFGDPADPGNPIVLIPLEGDPDVFDNPLPLAIQSPHRHLKEAIAQVASRREGGTLGSADITNAALIRSY